MRMLPLLLSAILLAACASKSPPAIAPGPYDGPPVEIRSGNAGVTGPQHTVILTAPTGGWTFRLDETSKAFEKTRVFLTVQRPNPAFMHTQALVTHEVATGVAADQPIAIYIRVLRHDETPGRQPYSPVHGSR